MFDQGIYVGRGGGSSGGQGITDVVANYDALPSAAAAADEFYFVESPQGTAWLPGKLGGTYYPAGLYYSNGVTWFYAESPYQATQAAVNAGVITDQFVSPFTLANATTVERPLTFSTGLTRTVNTITANISTGISGGQTIYGGTGASENLTIESTTHATKGNLLLNANQLSFTGYSATGSTASTEINRVLFTTDGRQWATGAITTQREFLITAPTYSFVAASTITNAATLAVTAAPTAGTNATITNAYSIWSQSGGVRFDDGTGYLRILAVPTITTTVGLFFNQATPSASNWSLRADTSNVTLNAPASSVLLAVAGGTRFTMNSTNFSFNPAAASAGASTTFAFVSSSDTNQTAGTEKKTFDLTSATIGHATGAITTQRFAVIGTPTYTFASASTITNAATLAVSAAPIAGTNATITNSYSIWSQSGGVRIDDGTSTTIFRSIVGSSSDAGIYLNQTSPSATNYVLRTSGTSIIINSTGNTSFAVNGTTRITIGAAGQISTSFSATSGVAFTSFLWTIQTSNTVPAGTEMIDINYNLSATKQWATGAIATQRDFLIQRRTYSFLAASTITTAATFAINGAPIAGTNATITNSYALWIQGGISRFDGNLSLNDAVDIVLGTTTGTKIGTGTTQKLGFWNAAPIVQPTIAVAAATFAANTSGIVDDTATFDGYTIGQVVKALRNTGLLA